MILLIIISIAILNHFAVNHVIRITSEWIDQQAWLIAQHSALKKHPDFSDDSTQALNASLLINRWTAETLHATIFLRVLLLLLLCIWAYSVLFSEIPYISSLVAMFEAYAIVYGWITWQRRHRTRGMCYAVQANIKSMEIYNKHTENE